MRNRYGQMDQDLYVRDLKKSLDIAISLVKRQAKEAHKHGRDIILEEDVDNFLYDMERE